MLWESPSAIKILLSNDNNSIRWFSSGCRGHKHSQSSNTDDGTQRRWRKKAIKTFCLFPSANFSYISLRIHTFSPFFLLSMRRKLDNIVRTEALVGEEKVNEITLTAIDRHSVRFLVLFFIPTEGLFRNYVTDLDKACVILSQWDCRPTIVISPPKLSLAVVFSVVPLTLPNGGL